MRRNSTSSLFLLCTCIFTYLLIRTRSYILSVAKYYWKLPSCKTNAFHCLNVSTYCTCTSHMYCGKQSVSSWHVSPCVTCMPKLCATVQVHTKFLSFTCSKHAGGTRVYQHTCVKFKLSCTIVFEFYIKWCEMVVVALDF